MSKETQTEAPIELDTNARHAPEQAEETWCPIIELRQYVHHPGRRDEFATLFDDYFIEEQERYGAFIPGQFRDRTDPDRFVWLRGFADMQTRQAALHDFYHVSPLWQEYRTAANDTIDDVSDVFLLRPARVSIGFHLDPANRPTKDAPEVARGIISATIYAFDAAVDQRFVDFFANTMVPLLRKAGATILGCFVTEPSENTYPALPVREGENVFVWFASFADETAFSSYQSALAQSQAWITSIAPALQTWGIRREEALELLPTRRSLLRHRAAAQEI
ncbi:NIPSNAP family containing protein [Dictyobacter sp. S3.2.2.5]|uniref:NIPSNAP family containing protein n=1 Tax=Dictyobacter halimunensis TaxID=3026934 RepID=A0ABQ6G3T9_9CHLR|nr:NIPSNAP family containing protein [Dictyobacter sp. S3.2.2.5]